MVHGPPRSHHCPAIFFSAAAPALKRVDPLRVRTIAIAPGFFFKLVMGLRRAGSNRVVDVEKVPDTPRCLGRSILAAVLAAAAPISCARRARHVFSKIC